MKTNYIIITFLIAFIPLAVNAQELEIKSFTLSPTDIIASSYQRKDFNGDACALVKVQIIDGIDRVEGNIIGDIVDRGTEKWVYLTEGTKEFRLFPKKHLPIIIKCANYGIEDLKGKQVYVLRLTDNNTTPTDTVKTQEDVAAKTSEVLTSDQTHEKQQTTNQTYERQQTTSYRPIHKNASDKQFTFGIRGGANLAWTQFEDSSDKAKMLTSFFAGVSMDIAFTEMFYVNTALLFSEKGYKYGSGNTEYTAKAQFIELPVQASLRFGDPENVQFQINAGPYAAMGIGGKIKAEQAGNEINFFDHYNSFDFGITVGAGLLFSEHYYVGANFQLGFADYRNRNISIGIGYNF